MARMLVLNKVQSRFYPDGIHHPFETSIDYPAMPALLCGLDRVLIDEGGEFQIWGGMNSDLGSLLRPLFPRKIFRENEHHPVLGKLLREWFDAQIKLWKNDK